jgi:hypothetical protein
MENMLNKIHYYFEYVLNDYLYDNLYYYIYNNLIKEYYTFMWDLTNSLTIHLHEKYI